MSLDISRRSAVGGSGYVVARGPAVGPFIIGQCGGTASIDAPEDATWFNQDGGFSTGGTGSSPSSPDESFWSVTPVDITRVSITVAADSDSGAVFAPTTARVYLDGATAAAASGVITFTQMPLQATGTSRGLVTIPVVASAGAILGYTLQQSPAGTGALLNAHIRFYGHPAA